MVTRPAATEHRPDGSHGPLHDAVHDAARGAAAAGGALLAVAVRGIGAVRQAPKPLHPRGRLQHGTLRRTGAEPPTGVPFLDVVSLDPVWVRESRAIGLPHPVPDVHGLALRVLGPDGHAGDLLLASSGCSRLGRFVLTASRDPWARPMTTLVPYRGPEGPIEISARRTDERTVALSCAVGSGPWRRFGELVVSTQDVTDPEDVSFDPVLHPLPGLQHYPVARRLRAPAYRTARAHRD